MPRIQYQPADIETPEDLVTAIRARRGGKLLNLDRMLLHSPPFANGWNSLLGEVRSSLKLPPQLRELAICLVAVLNDAEYEFQHHAPEFIKAGGTSDQLKALQHFNSAVYRETLFDSAELAVINLTLEMTRSVKVSDHAFAAAKAIFTDERQLVELVGVIATYNMVSRFLVALEVGRNRQDE